MVRTNRVVLCFANSVGRIISGVRHVITHSLSVSVLCDEPDALVDGVHKFGGQRERKLVVAPVYVGVVCERSAVICVSNDVSLPLSSTNG
jgi:hypothetical protein